jgi:hypothetical protein
MSYLSRDRIARIFRSPIAFCGALLVLASLAATAFALSSRAPNSLANYVSAICSQRFQSASPTEASYLAENVDAMTKMMFDMGIRPSGDIDSDFVAMMTPHHRGAIEMARAELRYGRNERLNSPLTKSCRSDSVALLASARISHDDGTIGRSSG